MWLHPASGAQVSQAGRQAGHRTRPMCPAAAWGGKQLGSDLLAIPAARPTRAQESMWCSRPPLMSKSTQDQPSCRKEAARKAPQTTRDIWVGTEGMGQLGSCRKWPLTLPGFARRPQSLGCPIHTKGPIHLTLSHLGTI